MPEEIAEIQELKKIVQQRKKDIIKIGRLLKQLKQRRLGKKYSEILNEIGISTRTASYYIKIAELENAQKLLDEVGYTKLVVLLEAKKLDENHLELAKTMSVSQLRRKLKGEDDKTQDKVEKVKKELKKIIKKSGDMETFKKAFVEIIKEIKEE